MKINYQKIVQRNLENVLHDVLKIISNEGLKEGHHLYITFLTNYQGVKIPKWLQNKYPEEMTIVIQYEFRNLNVKKNNFSINLSFNDINANLSIPYNAVVSFADPYANFGLQLLKSKLKQKKTNQNKRDTLKNKNQKNKGKIIKLSKYRKD